ncbi:hypothetical protein DVH05_007345 [Phytophthora capsici]|nr:hypothetical protein DVH05_007345 [Phytophthora capsici]
MHHALNEVVGHRWLNCRRRLKSTATTKKIGWAIEKTKTGEPTVPSTVKEKLATNPFMRLTSTSVQKFANGEKDPVKVMGILRAAKDNFVLGK